MIEQRIELNGAPASVNDLRAIALVNYGHFTSMQVRRGCVRGLDLHLDRLARATWDLFGRPLDVEATRGWMHRIVGGDVSALSLRVNVFSHTLDRDHMNEPTTPDVLVATTAARTIEPSPLHVRSVRYEREAPHIKHVGTFGLYHQRRLAQALGYDDALFVDASSAISEGTIWNVGFSDGERVVWPDATALDGVSMRLLKAGLRQCGVPVVVRRIELTEIASFRSAFFTNSSCIACPIARIDSVDFEIDYGLGELLEKAYAIHPWQRI